MTLPSWVKKHRQPRTEIKEIGGRFYVYSVSSEWDANKKRTRKISGKVLGKITKDGGFIKRESYNQPAIKQPIQTKEFGAVLLFESMMADSIKQLTDIFPVEWRQILVAAYARLVHQSPLKNIELHYEHSYLSELYPGVQLGSKAIGTFFQSLGTKRDQIRKFFASIKNRGEFVLIDGTHVLNNSNAELSEIRYSSGYAYRPQVNLLYIFDKKCQSPLYYRLLPGNIREVKSFQLSLKESGLSKAVIIADKGFYSQANVQELEESKLSYIIPLQRSSTLIDYAPLQSHNKKKLSGYFSFAKRVIWYSQNSNVTLFLDDELRLAEERAYLTRIETHPEKYSLELFHEKQHTFGTMAIISNLTDAKPETLYCQYKSRCGIEQLFDSFKSILLADRTYMRTDEGLEGWMFVNFIALSWYYKIYAKLLDADLLSKFSVADVIQRSAKIKKIRINDLWFTSEVTTITKKLLDALCCPVT